MLRMIKGRRWLKLACMSVAAIELSWDVREEAVNNLECGRYLRWLERQLFSEVARPAPENADRPRDSVRVFAGPRKYQ